MADRQWSDREAVLIALFQLGAARRAAHTEDVAMKAAELAPGHFRWTKYPEQINLESVRLHLKNRSADQPPFVTGGIRDGWMLTPAGVDWCEHAVGRLTDQPAATAGAAEVLQRTAAYHKFRAGADDTITVYDVRSFLRVDEYTSPRRRKERVQSVLNAAAGDDELSKFVALLRERYPQEWS